MRLCRTARRTLEADRVSVFIYDASAQTVSPYASDSPDDPRLGRLAEGWSRIRLEDFPAACTALLERIPVASEDARSDVRLPAGLATDFGITSVRLEPLVDERPVGILAIEPAAAVENADLDTIVPLLAASLSRVSSRRESEHKHAEAEFLVELTEAAMDEQSPSEMLATVCDRLSRQIGARRACVFLMKNGRMVPHMARYANGSRDPVAWQKFRRADVPLPAVEAAMQSGEPIIAEEPSSPMIAGWWAETFKIGSAVAVPLGKQPNVIGVLTIDAATPRRFTRDDVRLAAAAGAHIAGIVERAKASEERASHLRAATAIQRLLEEGSRAVSVREAGEVLARVTRDALGAEHASLCLGNEDGSRIDHVITVGVPDRFEAILREQLVGSPPRDFRIWHLTTRLPKPIFVENAQISQLLPAELVNVLGLQSYVALPLLSADRPLGLVICSHASQPRRWNSEQRQLVQQLALEGSLVVENAALRAAERERLDQLAHRAFHDPLTGMPNRALFDDRLHHALARAKRREDSVALLFVDLDDFKPINDSFGHVAGDQLLIAVGERVQACLRPEDTVARFGGDEFTILLEDVTDARDATHVADRVGECLKTPFAIDGHELSVTASIGIAIAGGSVEPEELMRSADQAMYRAKHDRAYSGPVLAHH